MSKDRFFIILSTILDKVAKITAIIILSRFGSYLLFLMPKITLKAFLFSNSPSSNPFARQVYKDVLAGYVTIKGVRRKTPIVIKDKISKQDSAWLLEYNSLIWLNDILIFSNDKNLSKQLNKYLQNFLKRWLDECLDFRQKKLFWQEDVVSNRLCIFYKHFSLFTSIARSIGLDKKFRRLLYLHNMLIRGSWHLGTKINSLPAIKAWWYYIHFNDLAKDKREIFISGIKSYFVKLLFFDGSPRDYNPKTLYSLLLGCYEMIEISKHCGYGQPDFLTKVIDKAVPALKTLIHSDNGLAIFNGSYEEDPGDIVRLLNKINIKAKAQVLLTGAGFYRLSSRTSVVIVDCSSFPSQHAENKAASTLAFEFSSEKKRIIVNCGYPSFADQKTVHKFKSTAASSTLVVNEINSSHLPEIQNNVFLKKSKSERRALVNTTPQKMSEVDKLKGIKRKRQDKNLFFEASHNGYIDNFMLGHVRRLELINNGNKLLGLDKVITEQTHNFKIWFHLHPTIKALSLANKSEVILKLSPKKIWKFTTLDYTVDLVPSVYCGLEGSFQQCLAMVVAGEVTKGSNYINWQIEKQ